MVDALAKKAKTCRGTQVWLEELPEDIASLVSFDVHWSLFSFIMNKLPGTASLVYQKKKKLHYPIEAIFELMIINQLYQINIHGY